MSPPSGNSHSNNPDCVLCQEYDPFQGSAPGHVLEEFFLTLYTMPTSSRTPFLLPKCTCCDCTSNRLLHLFVYLSHLTRLKVPWRRGLWITQVGIQKPAQRLAPDRQAANVCQRQSHDCHGEEQYELGRRRTHMSSCFVLFCFKETAASSFTVQATTGAKGPIPPWSLRTDQVQDRWVDGNGGFAKNKYRGQPMECLHARLGQGSVLQK